jgi:hypothetical protein
MTVLVVGGRSGDGVLAIDGIGLAESWALPGGDPKRITAKINA